MFSQIRFIFFSKYTKLALLTSNVNIIRNSCQVNKYLQYFKFVKGTRNENQMSLITISNLFSNLMQLCVF